MAVATREAPAVPTTVVHLITTLSQGGAERVLSQVVPRPGDVPSDASGAPRERHVVVSLVEGGLFADELVAAGVEVRSLRMRPGRDLLRGVWRLAVLLRTLRPTLVVSWMYHACLLLLLARPFAGPGRRTRTVWFLQGSLQAVETLSRSTRLIIRVLARLSHIPDAVAINSEAGRVDHIAAGYRPQRWVHLPNGCDISRFHPDHEDAPRIRSELGLSDDAIILMFVGRAHPEKGYDILLESVDLLELESPTELLLLGEGTESPSPVEGRVRIHGFGVRDDVDRILRCADVLILPSLSEGTPNAVIEAMATGVPCVVTDVGDSGNLVADTGIVVSAGSSAALAAGITELVELGAQQRVALGVRARLRIVERHSMGAARSAYYALWRKKA